MNLFTFFKHEISARVACIGDGCTPVPARKHFVLGASRSNGYISAPAFPRRRFPPAEFVVPL
jgi:hypothetical protein